MCMKQRSCDGRGARSAPFGMLNEPKKTGARSARARTRGQNPLVFINNIFNLKSFGDKTAFIISVYLFWLWMQGMYIQYYLQYINQCNKQLIKNASFICPNVES